MVHRACIMVHHARLMAHHARIMAHHARIMAHHARIMVHHARIMVHHARITVQHARIMVPTSWLENWIQFKLESSFPVFPVSQFPASVLSSATGSSFKLTAVRPASVFQFLQKTGFQFSKPLLVRERQFSSFKLESS